MSAEKVAHTPGPWTVRYGCIYGTVPERDPEYICEPWRRGHAETQANMHLICAAPDLLALAKRCARECVLCRGRGEITITSNFRGTESRPCGGCATIRAVIEKAEGGA